MFGKQGPVRIRLTPLFCKFVLGRRPVGLIYYWLEVLIYEIIVLEENNDH